MDNTSIPPVQPAMPPVGSGPGFGPGMGSGSGSGLGPSVGPGNATGTGMNTGPGMEPRTTSSPGLAPSGMPMVQQIQAPPEPKKNIVSIVKTVAIVVLALVSIAFIGLFIWKQNENEDLLAEWEGETAMAVAEAKDEQAMELANRYAEQMKYPYQTFTGPVDYGALSFEYPKTWSVYVDKAATNGGDFYAYFNPIQVDEVDKDTLNALRVTISNKSFDDVTAEYQRKVDQKNSGLTMEVVTIGDEEKGTQVTANRYNGVIPSTELKGSIVVFKIRDKTVILQTDSERFTGADEEGNLRDYEKLLGTVTFNA